MLYLQKFIKKKSIAILIKHLAIVIFFTFAYYIVEHMEHYSHEEKKKSENENNLYNIKGKSLLRENSSFFDYFYFSLITQTTVGYAQEVPLHRSTKIVNVIHLMTILTNIVIDVF